LAGGTITGGGDVTIDGAMNWTGGTLSTTGTTTIGTTATATLSSTAVRYLYNGTLVNAGAVVWSDGTIYSYSGGSIDNQAGGTFEVQGARSFTLQVAGGTFTNAGTLSKTGTGTASFTVPYSNTTTGLLDLQTDTLRLTAANTYAGTLSIPTGTVLWLSSGTQSIDTSLTGTGAVRFGGTITVNGTYSLPDLIVAGGSVTLNGPVTASDSVVLSGGTTTFNSTVAAPGYLRLSGGTLTGSADLAVVDSLIWSAGILSTTGTTTIPASATGYVTSTNVRYLYNGTLANAGAVVWSDGTIYSYSGGSIDNQAGGTFEVQGARSFTLQVAGGTFTNAGTLSKTGTGTAYFTVPYSNTTTGVLDLQTDTLRFTSTFDHQSGATLQGTGALNISSATPTFAGDIEPGAAGVPGMLTIVGDLTLQSSSNLNVDIDGYTLGTQYDQLAVTGVFTPAGTLTLNLDAAFVPNISTVFDIMTYSSITGDFTTTNGEGAPFGIGDRVLSAAPGATTYVVTVVAFP